MEPNPYQPPVAPPAAPPGHPSTYELYSPGQVVIAAVLGSPLAACWLMYLNHRRRGHGAYATRVLVVGTVATLALLLLAIVLPDRIGGFVPIATLAAVHQLAQRDRPLFEAHVAAGGRRASVWKAIGAGVGGMVAILAIVVPIAVGTDLLAGDQVDFGADQHVLYEEGATEADARKLGDYLVEIKFFNGQGGKDVTLKKDGAGFVVVFVVADGAWLDEALVHDFDTIRGRISSRVFGGRPVAIELCDDMLFTKKKIGP